MPLFKPDDSEYMDALIDGEQDRLLSTAACNRFNTSLLGLGDLKQPSKGTDAIAAVFDLQGFTNFCKQIEPHLSVPLFLSDFLSWLMNQLKAESIVKEHEEGVQLWSLLPFLVKFLGDGLLVLWDSSLMEDTSRTNIIVAANMICENYKNNFLPEMRSKVVNPPDALRCGIARGTVYSVGDGSDFVGPSINMAARLQKLPGLTFAFNRRGFDLESLESSDFFRKDMIVRKVPIRGIGDGELIGILRDEFTKLDPADRRIYQAP